jgi:hypothetical protein
VLNAVMLEAMAAPSRLERTRPVRWLMNALAIAALAWTVDCGDAWACRGYPGFADHPAIAASRAMYGT